MKRKIPGIALFCLFWLKGNTQNFPTYNPQPFRLYVPAFLPGIMDDPSVVLRNDTLIYDLTGQVFANGYKINTVSQPFPLINPWHTLWAMTDAYARKNKQKIIDLYTADSKQKITDIVNGPNATAFFDAVSKAAPNLELLAGINYQNGFAIYTQDKLYGMHENYLRQEGTGYKLAALKDQSPTGWNIALYFKFDPKPMVPVSNVALPDSIGVEDSIDLKIPVTETGRWVGVSLNNPGGPLITLAQDNGLNDFDPAPGTITIHLKGGMFYTPGTYEFYMYSLNFPVQRVSANFIKPQGRYTIKITE